MDSLDNGQTKETSPPPAITITDIVIKLMNLWMFSFQPRKISNFRWANSVRDAFFFLGEFAGGQFTKIYGRISTKHKYHKLQRYHNAIRQFDVTDGLGAQMMNSGNQAFYQTVAGQADFSGFRYLEADLTRLSDISTATTSGKYVYNEMCARKGPKAALAARNSYVRGFSRVVNASDFSDWTRLREELRSSQHLGAGAEDPIGDNVTLVAVSYKGKEVKITRRMHLLDEETGEPVEGEGIMQQEKIEMTSDFVDDFRWSQLVRSCVAIAHRKGTDRVRLWIDRLVMMGFSDEEKKRIYGLVNWEDFGLFAYAVCPVVRLYDAQEPYYSTDFWRKLETVMGVAGKGLILDDYMLRKYDRTIFFGPAIYERLDNGLSLLGGGGIYIRSVTLALATAVLTDGVTVSAANEDIRTKRATVAWKAWALRTIAEGAYSKQHSSMLTQEDAFTVGYRQFMNIAFWESMVSRCPALTGNSYLDMSFQRSMEWRKSACWDGILEWIGMLGDSCKIHDRPEITQFLTQQAEMKLYVSTTGHVASLITLSSSDIRDKRTIVVDLARYSTARHGHVTAVGEATGLFRGPLLPWYLRFDPDPDNDQKVSVTSDGLEYDYEQMKVEFSWMPIMRKILLVVVHLVLLVVMFINKALIIIVLMLWFITAMLYFCYCRPWPWVDQCDVGEAVFDNLLLHGLYDAGIKKQYRKLKIAPYDQIGWSGSTWDK